MLRSAAKLGSLTLLLSSSAKMHLAYWAIGNSFVGHLYYLKLRLRMSTIHIAIFVYSFTLAWNT